MSLFESKGNNEHKKNIGAAKRMRTKLEEKELTTKLFLKEKNRKINNNNSTNNMVLIRLFLQAVFLNLCAS